MAKIALGTWAWGAGAFGGDAVFGSKTDEPDLAPYKEMILHKNAEWLLGLSSDKPTAASHNGTMADWGKK